MTHVPVDEVEVECPSVVADGKNGGNARSRPPRPGSPHGAGYRGVAAGGTGVKEGAATDQEESGDQRERGRPASALSAKSSKIEDGLSSLRIRVTTAAADGVSVGEGGNDAGFLLEGGEGRGRQDSSRSPLPHENGAGGEDDASVLDTPLQDKVS